MYVDHRSKLEDTKSTGYSFTLVGGAGLLLLVLIDTNVISLSIQPYMKIILSVVMGILFLIFLAIGIHSFLSLGRIRREAGEQENEEKEFSEWFLENHKKEIIAYRTADMDENAPDTLYYPRYEKMNELLSDKYPDLSDDSRDHLIESLYEKIFR